MFKGLKLDPGFIEEENIIAKLQLVMQLEKVSPYAKGSVFDPLPERMLRALRVIPNIYQQYVLALFANTFYCTEQFSTSIMLHLYNTILHTFNIKSNEFAQKCLVLEVDPSGMINEFLRLNKVQGRLDKVSFPREQQLDSFVNKMILKNGLDTYLLGKSETDTEAISQILNEAKFSDDSHQLDKEYWVILTDNALSGTSLCSAIKRLCGLADKYSKSPKIIILVRTLTDQAHTQLKTDFFPEITSQQIHIEYGLLLKKDYAIKNDPSKKCKLFNDKDTIAGIINASEWLAESSEFKEDVNLKDHKKNSGDDLRFGFKKCGLTFVSAENCPSNSLPFLWYKNDNFYIAPFPRVISRIGGNLNDKG